MTDTVELALIAGIFGSINVAISTVGSILSRKAQREAKAAADNAKAALTQVGNVHSQALENFNISQANHATLSKVVENTDGNVTKMRQDLEREAQRRAQEAFEAGRRAEITKNRRATDPPVNDDTPKE